MVGGEHERLERAAVLVAAALVLAERVGGEQRALDERAGMGVADVVRDLPAQRLGPKLLRAAHDPGRRHPRALGVEGGAPAEPGDDVAAPFGVRHGELAERALGLAGVHQRLQDPAVIVSDPLVLEDADDDRVGLRGGRSVGRG